MILLDVELQRLWIPLMWLENHGIAMVSILIPKLCQRICLPRNFQLGDRVYSYYRLFLRILSILKVHVIGKQLLYRNRLNLHNHTLRKYYQEIWLQIIQINEDIHGTAKRNLEYSSTAMKIYLLADYDSLKSTLRLSIGFVALINVSLYSCKNLVFLNHISDILSKFI